MVRLSSFNQVRTRHIYQYAQETPWTTRPIPFQAAIHINKFFFSSDPSINFDALTQRGF